MIHAEKVEFSDHAPLVVGGVWSGYEITKIETYHDEYPDHSEMTVIGYTGTTQVVKIWNRPVIVTYKVSKE